jgi:hypothetical protein
LLDAEVAVGDPFPSGPLFPGREGQERFAHLAVVEHRRVRERRVKRREQAAVERRHAQRAGATSMTRESCQRLQGFPHAPWRDSQLDLRPQGLDRVALAVDGMPARDEPARLGKQQEQDAVDNDERFVNERDPITWTIAATPARGGRKSAGQVDDR